MPSAGRLNNYANLFNTQETHLLSNDLHVHAWVTGTRHDSEEKVVDWLTDNKGGDLGTQETGEPAAPATTDEEPKKKKKIGRPRKDTKGLPDHLGEFVNGNVMTIHCNIQFQQYIAVSFV